MFQSEKLEAAIRQTYMDSSRDCLAKLLFALLEAGKEGGQLIVPVAAQGEDAAGEPLRVQTEDGSMWLAGFTSKEEYELGESCDTVSWGYFAYMEKTMEAEEVQGIMLNPWGNAFLFSKELIRMVRQVREQDQQAD